MEENANNVNFEEVTDNEINDIWDMLFWKQAEKKERLKIREQVNLEKPRRYLKFLTM